MSPQSRGQCRDRRSPTRRGGRPGGSEVGARRPARSASSPTPRPGARRSAARSSSVPTSRRMSPGRARSRRALLGLSPLEAAGGQRPLADDHGVHELHGHVPGMGRPLRRHTPHGGSRRKGPGQGEGGGRQRRCLLRGDGSSGPATPLPRRGRPRPLVRGPGRRRWGGRAGASAPRGGTPPASPWPDAAGGRSGRRRR